MKEQLREINRSLRTLDEAHRLGRISREDYRQRRRHLLGTLCDGGGITARSTERDRTVPRAPGPNPQGECSRTDESASGAPSERPRRFAWWRRPHRRH